LSEKHKDVVFLGVGTDPKEEDLANLLKKGELKVTFPVAFDEGKKVNAAFRDVLQVGAVGIPHAFLIGKDSKIVWHEQFSQAQHLSKGVFTQQLSKYLANEPLLKFGPKPKVEEEDDEGESADFDPDSLFG